MSAVDADPRSRWFSWKRLHPAEAEDPASVWAAAWKAGSWDAIRRNAQLGLNLSQIVQRLEELANLYRDVDIERDIEREMEEASAYWHDEQVDESVPT